MASDERKLRQGARGMLGIILAAAIVVTLLTTGVCANPSSPAAKTVTWNFDTVPVGKLPPGWRVEATNQHGPLSVWQVIQDQSAPSGRHVLALTDARQTSGSTFNLCWTSQVTFLDGEISVQFKAVKGNEDEGGGIMWRVRDKNNYYVARFNPLEDNFRIYYIRNGNRRMIGTARVSLPAGKWQTMKILVNGDHYTCSLNGHKYLDVHDRHFLQAGGVGVWTKADAVTSFDDFTVRFRK